jgi:SAM-dependent methyltransferase
METITGIGLADVQAVYDGAEGDLWELVMGEQIHVGGLAASTDLAERAGIVAGSEGVDLCCCNGAGMRFLVRFREVARMTGVDATERVVERGRLRCRGEGLADQIRFVVADATASGLETSSSDFVWGEDAWCYVADKQRLIGEAVRIVRPGGTIAFTDWVAGPTALEAGEADRFLRFMKFPNIVTIDEYVSYLEGSACIVTTARDTDRFASHVDLYLDMLTMQLTYDALKVIDFDGDLMQALGGEMAFIQQLAHEKKIIQGQLIATVDAE